MHADLLRNVVTFHNCYKRFFLSVFIRHISYELALPFINNTIKITTFFNNVGRTFEVTNS
jgi:hypothetical protein